MEFAKQAIQKNKIVMFSWTYCPFCQKAKALLQSLNAEFTSHELDKMENGKEIKDALLKLTGQETVPNIFINQKHVGGCDDLHSLHSQGKLIPLLTNK